MTYNVLKLHLELVAAGIPIVGVSSEGQVDFLPEATEAQKALAASILAAHDPTDYVQQAAQISRVAIQTMLVEALADYDTALSHWTTLTATQKDTILKQNTQVLRYLLAFFRNQFET